MACENDSGRWLNHCRSRNLTRDDIGKEFIRTKPAIYCGYFKDYSYIPKTVNDIENNKMTLVDIDKEGKLIFSRSDCSFTFTVEGKNNDNGWTEASKAIPDDDDLYS